MKRGLQQRITAFLNVLGVSAVILLQIANVRLLSWIYIRSKVTLQLNPQYLTTHTIPEYIIVFGAILVSVSPLFMGLAVARIFRNRSSRVLCWNALAIILSLYYALDAILLFYNVIRGFPFDFYLLWYNLHDAIDTLRAIIGYFDLLLLFVVLFVVLHFRGLIKIFDSLQWYPKRSTAAFLASAVFTCIVSHALLGNEIINGVLPLFTQTSEVERLYDRYYHDSLKQNKLNQALPVHSAIGENLFIIQLESINAKLVNETVTPRWVRLAAEKGVMFSAIQGGAVLTMRAQETILCSILPALELNTASSAALTDGLVCLPRLLQRLGYRTLFFHSFPDIHFSNTELFMKRIGFDERHASDIMKPGDTLLDWGYLEEIFYQRVFEYLQRYRGEKIFAYITVSSTNHYPFSHPESDIANVESRKKLPFRNATTVAERVANTTFLQDEMFGAMYDKWFKPRYAEDSHMVVLGDHSWPIGNRINAKSNDQEAFQDNFLTSMALLPARGVKDRFSIGTRVDGLFSQLDFMPTIAELFGVKDLTTYGKSFLYLAQGKLAKNRRPRCTVSVQPFGGRKIAIIEYPMKRVYDVAQQQVRLYDLENDPGENAPVKIGNIDSAELSKLQDCIQSLRPHSEADQPSRSDGEFLTLIKTTRRSASPWPNAVTPRNITSK